MRICTYTLTLFMLLILTSCGTSKGYIGEKLPTHDLAIINGSTNPIIIDGKKHKERVFIVKVNQKEVGSYSKGWPKNVKIKEGINEIEVRHFRTWKYQVEYNGGGGLGGLQAGLDNERSMVHEHYVLSFNVEKNKKYSIGIKSDPSDLEKVSISITDEVTKAEIDFESYKKIINNSELDALSGEAKVDDLGNGKLLIYNAAGGLYKNKLNTGRITIWIDDKLLGHIDPNQYILINLENGKKHFKLLHIDVVNFKSEHDINITNETKIIKVKPTIFSNKLEVTNKLPKNFERFKNAIK